MLSLIRRRFTYTNVVLTFALLFAMSGGAYAAKKYLITSAKQISPGVLKSLKGADGKPGIQGATGAAGAAGLKGDAGVAGVEGPAGKEGPEGKEGPQGPRGPKGAVGSPWTAGGTLPSEATETGVWSYGKMPNGSTVEEFLIPISFPVPLATALGASSVHFINSAREELFGFGSKRPPSPACAGSAVAPTAGPGNLCVYEGFGNAASISSSFILNPASEEFPGASTAGAVLKAFKPEAGHYATGTWAVTAE